MNCIKTCPREQMNNFLQNFFHVKCRVKNFQTALFCNFTRGWETGKEPRAVKKRERRSMYK